MFGVEYLLVIYLCRKYGILYSRRRRISPIYLSYNDNTFRFLNYFKGLRGSGWLNELGHWI
jgi:hypothetical protein